jgi:Zn-dependent peptidase ImmA (M78 family)
VSIRNPEVRDAEGDAARILASVWQRGFPVDPVVIANALGVEVKDATLRENIAGAIVKERGQDAVILVNAVDHPNRKRFTCAHELGHFVMHERKPDSYEYVDLRDALASLGTDEHERYANSFAAALLMPESEVARLVDEGRSQTEMSYHFGVSQEAMYYRLKNLNLAT